MGGKSVSAVSNGWSRVHRLSKTSRESFTLQILNTIISMSFIAVFNYKFMALKSFVEITEILVVVQSMEAWIIRYVKGFTGNLGNQ